MSERKRRLGLRAGLLTVVAALAVAAAGCGGDDEAERRRLADRGPRLDAGGDPGERQERGPGQHRPVAGVRDARRRVHGGDRLHRSTPRTPDTGDDMISLIQSGEYDGVSASGHTSVRLMAAGDVAPVNTELLPNYADVHGGHQGSVVQLEGRRAVRCTARTRAEPARVPHRRRDARPGQLVGRLGREHAVQGQALDLRRLDLHRRRCAVPEGDAARPRDREPVPADAGAVRRVGRAAQDAGAQRRRVVGRLREADPVVRQQGQRRRNDLAAAGHRCSRATSSRSRGSSRRRARRAGRTRG